MENHSLMHGHGACAVVLLVDCEEPNAAIGPIDIVWLKELTGDVGGGDEAEVVDVEPYPTMT